MNYLFWELEKLDYIIGRYDDKDFWIDLGGNEESTAKKIRYKEIKYINLKDI